MIASLMVLALAPEFVPGFERVVKREPPESVVRVALEALPRPHPLSIALLEPRRPLFPRTWRDPLTEPPQQTPELPDLTRPEPLGANWLLRPRDEAWTFGAPSPLEPITWPAQRRPWQTTIQVNGSDAFERDLREAVFQLGESSRLNFRVSAGVGACE